MHSNLRNAARVRLINFKTLIFPCDDADRSWASVGVTNSNKANGSRVSVPNSTICATVVNKIPARFETLTWNRTIWKLPNRCNWYPWKLWNVYLPTYSVYETETFGGNKPMTFLRKPSALRWISCFCRATPSVSTARVKECNVNLVSSAFRKC